MYMEAPSKEGALSSHDLEKHGHQQSSVPTLSAPLCGRSGREGRCALDWDISRLTTIVLIVGVSEGQRGSYQIVFSCMLRVIIGKPKDS